ncbi:hypothetical protein N0V90_003813 [Kalmusia sp. IMI 367209]|nr:hypothetical protein N0V90_003813 [Kalmusia sp. IMI 367209]
MAISTALPIGENRMHPRKYAATLHTINNPVANRQDDEQRRTKKRAVRSHVVRRTVERKRGNFRNTSARRLEDERHEAHSDSPTPRDRITALNYEMLDPFESLAVDQSRLQSLLRHPSAQQAVEPVFSITNPYSFHDLHEAYANAFTDPAFSNALMCAISLTKNNYIFTPDVLHYQGLAIDHINRQLNTHTSYECTIGAILLLVGVEWRTTSHDTARVHLKGIEKLVQICESERHTLSASVRRGIFWQDVNTAIVSAKDRVLDRAMFPEFEWGRATFMVDWARLSSGFENMRNELGDTILEVTRDIYVLQKHSEALAFCKPNLAVIHQMDNMQACIEARLIERLQESEDSRFKTMVLLTMYLYTYSLHGKRHDVGTP